MRDGPEKGLGLVLVACLLGNELAHKATLGFHLPGNRTHRAPSAHAHAQDKTHRSSHLLVLDENLIVSASCVDKESPHPAGCTPGWRAAARVVELSCSSKQGRISLCRRQLAGSGDDGACCGPAIDYALGSQSHSHPPVRLPRARDCSRLRHRLECWVTGSIATM